MSLARLRHVPITAAAMITAADVPLAMTGSRSNSRIIAGTMMMPPPTPSRPARIPVTRPTTTRATTEAHGQPAPPVGVGGEEQAQRRPDEHDDEDDGEGALGQDVEQPCSDDRAADGADRQPRGHVPIDVAVGGVADERRRRDRDDGGQRRAMGQTLGHVRGEHEAGDDEDPAADTEETGEEAGAQTDDGDRCDGSRMAAP